VVDSREKAKSFLDGFQQAKGFEEEIVFLCPGAKSQEKPAR
jgi:hypothetical protein